MARNFDTLPGVQQAEALLDELAEVPRAVCPSAIDRPIALYGAGSLGRLARDYLKLVGCDFVVAIDRAAERLAADPEWAGVQMLAPGAVPNNLKRAVKLAVSVVTTPYVPLEASLFADGFDDVVPFYDVAENFRHLHPLSNGWLAAPLTAEDQRNTATVLARWDDDVSRAHHLQFLAWRRLRQEWSFAGASVTNHNRFLIPEIRELLRDDEVFVDGGAHHGEVSEAFASAAGAFRQIVAIEPDGMSWARLVVNFNARLGEAAPTLVYDCALSNVDGEATFHEGLGYASQLSATGHMRVMRRCLDTLDVEPTVIKLHLEGEELPALIGARDTLMRQRPIVMATVYHNEDGIWRTADWLIKTLPEYRMLFRTHSWCGTGAVIYAIPNERGPYEPRH